MVGDRVAEPSQPTARNGGPTRRVVSPRLVGRQAELARLGSAVAGPPAVAVVEGEAGIGKTRLVSELRSRPDLAGARFLVGSCRRIRDPFPLASVLEAVRRLGDDLGSARLSPVAGALRPLLPELAHLLPPRPDPLDDRNAQRHREFRGLVEVLANLGPAVLVLEDLHWTDRHTLDFISYLLGDPPPALSLVLTFRGEEVPAAVRALTAGLPPAVSRTDLVLAPLDQPQTGELAAAILGTDQLPAELAGYLWERAAGVPFAIEELLALLRSRGALDHRVGGWVPAAVAEQDVPTGIRDSVLARVGRLSSPARSVAEAAAVLQAPVPAPVLLATARGRRARARRGLAEVVDSGLFTDRGGVVGFRHLLAAQAVYDAVGGLRRRDLHRHAAAALRGLDRVPLGQVAYHLRRAGLSGDWAATAIQAAEQAVALGDDAEAVRLLEEPLREAPLDPERRGRLAARLAEAASGTLQPAHRFLDLLWEVLDQDPPRAVRGELRFWLAMLLEHTEAEPRLLRRLLAEAVTELDHRPDLKAWAMICLGCPVVPGTSRAEHQQWLRRTLAILPEIPDPDSGTFLLGKVAMVQAAIGDPGWRPLTAQVDDRTGGAPRRRSEVKLYHSIGQAACYAGHLPEAGRLLAAGLAGAVATESSQLELRIRAAQVLLDYCRGDWHGLASTADAMVARLAAYPPSRFEVEVVAACLALARGELADAGRRLADLVTRLARRGAFDLLAIPAAALARTALAGPGDGNEVVAGIRQFLAAVESVGVVVSAVRALPAAAAALVAAGEVREARGLVARYARRLHGLDAPLAPAALRDAYGYVVAASGRPASAARLFGAAAQRYRELGCPYEAAQAHEQAARAALALPAGEPGAGPWLHAALATYQRLGAGWDAARASRLARRHGIPVPARHRGGHRGYGTDLSPREQEVSRYAATGRTNQEIADALFVSPNTVKKQLAAAMRKLGVRSRAELAHRLAARPGLVGS